AMFIVSISKSLHATTGPKDSEKRPRPDSTCSPARKTMQNCAAFSTLRKSARGSIPCEISSHPHGGAPVFRLYGRGVPLPLPCGYTFGVFHLPTVLAVHQGQTRQTQRCLCAKHNGKEARQ